VLSIEQSLDHEGVRSWGGEKREGEIEEESSSGDEG
jgi:hypothetical protein